MLPANAANITSMCLLGYFVSDFNVHIGSVFRVKSIKFMTKRGKPIRTHRY